MTVTLTEERKQKVMQTCIDLLRQKRSKMRSVASCIGLLVSSLPGVPLGQLHYRGLERDKNSALREKGGNWERYMVVSAKGRGDLLWRTQHLPQPRAEKEIRPPSVSLTTDSSQVGWGAVRKGPDQEETLTQGLWSETDKHNHISYLELRAELMGL